MSSVTTALSVINGRFTLSVKFEIRNHVGWVTLSRPEKLNALSYEMIQKLYEQLLIWRDDERVYFVCLEGEGDKSFSAGGDVVHLYHKRNDDIEDYAFGFFHTEYCMNELMHLYPKPIVTFMNGIVMGGGVGVAVAGSHRVVNETTKWAMPEMNIGLYPDVGGSYFLNKVPGYLGRYLALTSRTIAGIDVLYAKAADHFIPKETWSSLKKMFDVFEWDDHLEEQLSFLMSEYEGVCEEASYLKKREKEINKHFKYDTIEAIFSSLSSEDDNDWAKDTLELLKSKSPSSLKVTLEQLVRGRDKDIRECLMMELNMSMNFMKHHDFFEGVRSVLVDKDKLPKWSPKTLEDISKDDVDDYFTYPWKGEHPLSKLV